jgi:hypothetical protein
VLFLAWHPGIAPPRHSNQTRRNTQTSDQLATGGEKKRPPPVAGRQMAVIPTRSHLLPYVSSGTYSARINIKGKLIRERL